MASEYWVAIERKRRQSGAVAGSMAGDYQFVPRYVHAVQVVRDMPEPESVCGRYKYPIQGSSSVRGYTSSLDQDAVHGVVLS
jgi:hypothetical protein